MFKTYNKQNNTYTRYIHISEIEAALEKMKKISSRVQYKSFNDIPEGNQVEDYHLTIDDAKSLEKLFDEYVNMANLVIDRTYRRRRRGPLCGI